MELVGAGLAALVAVTLVLIAVACLNPRLVRTPPGKVLAFLGFFVLPLTVTGLGTASHLKQATSTEFCVSCHVMEPYGKSLLVDDETWVPAVHFQDNLTPRDQSCYSCHTNYTMFGDLKAKIAGLKHVYVYYLGTVPEKIELYQPYQNRECLSCHGASRSFSEDELHAEIYAELLDESTSCLECHDMSHGVDEVHEQELWTSDDPLVTVLRGE